MSKGECINCKYEGKPFEDKKGICLSCSCNIESDDTLDKFEPKRNKMVTITFDKNSAEWILETLDLDQVCHFCHNKITKDNLSGIFDKNKVSCSKLECVIKLSDYIEKKE